MGRGVVVGDAVVIVLVVGAGARVAPEGNDPIKSYG